MTQNTSTAGATPTVSAAEQVERTLVRRLVRELKAKGFVATQVWDGEEYVAVRTEGDVLDAVFAVGSSTIHFDGGRGRGAAHMHGVLIVCGNGEDCISDWHCPDAAFDFAMERITAGMA